MLCVTGGGSGIGRAVCQALAKEGAAVAAADINWKQVEETIKLLDTGTFLLLWWPGCCHKDISPKE